jgi:hypothetical protein
MKDAYELLYQREADLVRVRQEIESLRIAASLLADDASADDPGPGTDNTVKRPAEAALVAQSEGAATGTDGLAPRPRQPNFWEFLKPGRR